MNTATMDVINGLFECVGSVFLWMSVRALYKAKGYAGVWLGQMAIYTVWGLWNLLYYPSLGQWWSAIAGVNVFVANATWLYLALKYGRLDR